MKQWLLTLYPLISLIPQLGTLRTDHGKRPGSQASSEWHLLLPLGETQFQATHEHWADPRERSLCNRKAWDQIILNEHLIEISNKGGALSDHLISPLGNGVLMGHRAFSISRFVWMEVLLPVVHKGIRSDCAWLQVVPACMVCVRKGGRKKVLQPCCGSAHGTGGALCRGFLHAIWWHRVPKSWLLVCKSPSQRSLNCINRHLGEEWTSQRCPQFSVVILSNRHLRCDPVIT